MRAVSLMLLVLAGHVAAASAQPVARFADLPLRLNLDDEVGVDLDPSGATTWGRVVRLDAESLTLRTADGERRFTAATATRVRRRGDPLRNGVVTGAAIGALAGCLFAASFAEAWRFEDCPAGALFIAPVGAGLGLVVDAARRGTVTVYTAGPDAAAPPGLRLQLAWRW